MDLSDNQKRWVVTGVALNKVVVPSIRALVQNGLETEYSNLKTSNAIDAQTHHDHLNYWPGGGRRFNYQNINGNECHKKDFTKFDYNVKSAVDLGRMCLQQHMAQFSSFDETCDGSALLNLLGCVPRFAAIKTAADDVRSKVRNEWAHCNFDEWGKIKFSECFKHMAQLLKALRLRNVEKDLSVWETKGLAMFLDSPSEMQKEVAELRSDFGKVTSLVGEEATRIKDVLSSIYDDLRKKIEQLQVMVVSVATGMQTKEQGEKHQAKLEEISETLKEERKTEIFKGEKHQETLEEIKVQGEKLQASLKEVKDLMKDRTTGSVHGDDRQKTSTVSGEKRQATLDDNKERVETLTKKRKTETCVEGEKHQATSEEIKETLKEGRVQGEKLQASLEEVKDLMKNRTTGSVHGDDRQKTSTVHLEGDGHTVLPPNLDLRCYQRELAEPALQGNNTIICAPTNSGKTFVAMEIAKKHLDKHSKKKGAAVEIPDNIEGPKVIFIVGTQNLVNQQRSRFESYLSNYAISDISGVNSTEIPLEFLLKANNVVVLTAQILLNALERKNSCLELSHITLLIFDECHHTQKDHAYNKIMQLYMDMKLGQADQQPKLPQVVGLTASLGVGKSNTVENAVKHIMQLCANMDAMGISTVRENSQELLDSVSGEVAVRRVIRVDSSTATNPFHQVFDQVMSKIETAARSSLETLPSPPQNRLSQQYRQWIETVTKKASLLGFRRPSTYIEQLKRYHIALQYNHCVRMKDAMSYLDEYFNGLDESKFTEYEQGLKTLFQKGKEKVESNVALYGESANPKLEILKALILEFNEMDNGTSKGILFSRTRVSTVGLEEWIKETEELKYVFRPKALVGGGDGEVGMSQGEQEEIIADFKKGVVNILIATTVAEEGLDIRDCGYVIRYDMMGNEISSTQSRGRIRAKDGAYAYVADARSKGHEREKLNQYREMLMIDAVAKVQSLDANEYSNTIEKLQRNSALDRKLKIEAMKRSPHQQQVVDARFHCRKCDVFACEAKHLRRVRGSYHIVIDRDFRLNKMEIRPHRKPKQVDGITMDKKVHCKICGEDWGVTAKIYGEEWPVLKICSFVLKLRDGERKTYRKWREAGLNIPEVDNFAEELPE